MNEKLNRSDTFLEWMEKINNIISNTTTPLISFNTLSELLASEDISDKQLVYIKNDGANTGMYYWDNNKWEKINDSRVVNAVQSSQITESTGTSTTQIMSQKAVTDALNTKADSTTLVTELDKKADNTITISAGTGLSGGGNLTANRTLSVKYGTTAGTVAQGNDSRIVNAVQTAGTGLSKSGTTLSVNYGTTSTTAARGDDSRITGAAQKSANLSDLDDVETARSNLGLGDAAIADVVGTMANGAIIESGSNANGGYIKFADGTQICEIDVPPVNVEAYVWRVFKWYYPTNFVVNPSVSVTSTEPFNLSVGSGLPASDTSTLSRSSTRVAVTNLTSTSVRLGMNIVAIGRWY